MKLIKIAPGEIVNIDAIAYAKYDDGTQSGPAAKGHVSLSVLFHAGEQRNFGSTQAN